MLEGLEGLGGPGEAARMVRQAVSEVVRSQGGTQYTPDVKAQAQNHAGTPGRAPEGDYRGEGDLYPTMGECYGRQWNAEDGAESNNCGWF